MSEDIKSDQNSSESEALKHELPNATATLVLGIVSIILVCCYYLTLIGIVLAVIGVVLGNKDMQLYNENPQLYKESSYKYLKAGRICSIVSLCLAGIVIIFVIIWIFLFGTALITGLSQIPFNEID
ncbi:MAG: CCC motif membrane protein [Flavobacteriales bacterium]